MRMGKKQFIKYLIAMLSVCAMMVTSIPKTKVSVSASTQAEDTIFKSVNHRKLNVGSSYNFDLVNKKTGAKYQWSTDDSAVATVNKNGVVYAVGIGECTITCIITINKKETNLKADVSVFKAAKCAAEDIKINNKISSMAPGETYDLNRTLLPKKSSDHVNWVSSNSKIATVDEKGIVTAKAKGSVKIYAYTVTGDAKDAVSIKISDTVKASSQKDIDRLLKADQASTLIIDTDKDKVLTIAKGDYSSKKLIVNVPNATIKNEGLFNSIEIRALKPSTWKEFTKGNLISLHTSTSISIAENSDAHVVINASDIKVNFIVNGALTLDIKYPANLTFSGNPSELPKVICNTAGSELKSSIAMELDLKSKAILDFNKEAADRSIVNVQNGSVIPIIKGDIKITVKIGDKTFIVSANGVVQSDTSTATGDSTGGSAGGDSANTPGNEPSIPTINTAKLSSLLTSVKNLN